MEIVFCILIGVLASTVAVFTIKCYIPRIVDSKNKKIKTDNPPEGKPLDADENASADSGAVPELKYTFSKKRTIILAVFSGIFGALVGYFAFINASDDVALMKLVVGFVVLTCAMVTDVELMIVPNLCSLVLIIGRVVFCLIELLLKQEGVLQVLLRNLITAVVVLAFLLILSKITKGGIGMGDVKTYSSLAFLCGTSAIVYTFIISLFFSAIASVVFLLSKKKKIKDALPMGPFIWLAFGVSVMLSLA